MSNFFSFTDIFIMYILLVIELKSRYIFAPQQYILTETRHFFAWELKVYVSRYLLHLKCFISVDYSTQWITGNTLNNIQTSSIRSKQRCFRRYTGKIDQKLTEIVIGTEYACRMVLFKINMQVNSVLQEKSCSKNSFTFHYNQRLSLSAAELDISIYSSSIQRIIRKILRMFL